MKVYKYDELTKEFKGVEDAFLDQLETELQGKECYLLPANATFEVPTEQEGYASVWNGEKWKQVEDNRGKRYWLDTDTYGTPAREVTELGAFPANAVFEAPQPALDELKNIKLQEVDQWTANKITGGFVSECSGQPVRYDSDTDTQQTMQGIAVNADKIDKIHPKGIPVRGYVGKAIEKTIQYLNGEQVLKFCEDLSLHIGACKIAGWQKQAEVKAAETKEELEAIVLN